MYVFVADVMGKWQKCFLSFTRQYSNIFKTW